MLDARIDAMLLRTGAIKDPFKLTSTVTEDAVLDKPRALNV
jgi:hypothetical protein